jgi:hypothetical protein
LVPPPTLERAVVVGSMRSIVVHAGEGGVADVTEEDVSRLYGAMVLEDTRFLMTSNVISGASERTAIRFAGSDGRFLLNTVTGNGDPSLHHPGAIDCGASPVVLEDSIIAGNLLGAGGRAGSHRLGDARRLASRTVPC